MALVRVYCGLASADLPAANRLDSADRTAPTADVDGWLTAAVVDDAGRLLDVCEVSDNPAGYARLCTVLAERSGGTAVAIAADSDDRRLSALLTASGRPLAIADDDTVDDYAERFADDDSTEEMESPPAERRAVGLARALQAGALSAVSMPAPRDLAGLKGVLVAHAALTTGRYSAAVALREVLRELHPAALRAYPDPAEPVPLAVLDALPEPQSLTNAGTPTHARDTAATDAIANDLATGGVADPETIKEAITALRVAIAETPRRGPANKVPNTTIAEIIRHAVAAVRACDAACDGLISSLTERLAAPGTAPPANAPAARLRSGHRSAPGHAHTPAEREGAQATGARRTLREPGLDALPNGRRTRPVPGGGPDSPRPVTAPPMAPQPFTGPPVAPSPMAPAGTRPIEPLSPAASGAPGLGLPGLGMPGSGLAGSGLAGSGLAPEPLPAHGRPPTAPVSPPSWVTGTGSNRPVSPPMSPGSTPATAGHGRPVPPAETGQPFRPTLTTAAMNSARAERAAEQRQSVAAAVESRSAAMRAIRRRTLDPNRNQEDSLGPAATGGSPTTMDRDGVTAAVEGRGGAWAAIRDGEPIDGDRWIDEVAGAPARFGATDFAIPVPLPRPQSPAPGSRGNWPLVSTNDSHADMAGPVGLGPDQGYGSEMDLAGGGRVTPPWQADDLPPEPPSLRLVEPPPLADRALREDWAGREATGELPSLSANMDLPMETPSLRLVGSGPDGSARGNGDWAGARDGTSGGRRSPERRAPAESPLPDEGDGDLLIFAQARSAWFIGQEDEVPDWASIADFGWQEAAERTTRPSIGAETPAGLPRRVPQANLLPGSPLSSTERPLQIVRDAATIASHTSGYFSGWRRGQEINGYPVGGRPGRESAGGWDFSRDTGGHEDEGYNYRSARL